METLQAFFGVSLGFWFYQLFSSPSHKLYIDKVHPNLAKKLRALKYKIYGSAVPNIKLKSFQLTPNITIRVRGRVIWIHHWIPLSITLGVLLHETNSFSQLLLLKSFCFGGAVQGLFYKDRFKVFGKVIQEKSLLSRVSGPKQ